MNPPIPPYTIVNLCNGIGDVMRASAAWGMADASKEQTEAYITAVGQAVAQLLTLALQREPTVEEMTLVIGG